MGAPFAAALAEPILVRCCAAIAGAQIILSALHLPAWPCVFYHVTGLPCPGCGLTRSCIALAEGHPLESLRYHLFGPLLLAGIVLMAVLAFLPARVRSPIVRAVASLERRTWIIPILFVLFCLYWPLRLAGVFPLPA